VQIYETILEDVHGQVTTVLLNAASYAKDNRLLPKGFDKTAVPDEVVPHGVALQDANFISGSDTVTYTVALGDASGPFTVEVELLYQPIAHRWAANAGAYNTPESQAFWSYYQRMPNQPERVAQASATVSP